MRKLPLYTVSQLIVTEIRCFDTAERIQIMKMNICKRDLNNNTLKCLSIGTPKAINFPFVSNEILMFFGCPSIQAHCNEAVIYEGISKSFEPNMERARNLDLFCFIFQRSPLPTPHTCPI